ncbi:MAG: DoxX family protein [Marinilabiliales bacterium]|nr:MAG: DoxX family protein [Marinilabiliales bacterium]
MKRNIDLGLLVLRISIGVLMLLHGIAKIGKLDFIKMMLTKINLPEFIAYGVYLGEILAPVLIIIGFRTRLASAIFAFNALTAILLVHSSEIFTITEHGGWGIELLGLYLFGAIALIFSGGGKYALSQNNKWD